MKAGFKATGFLLLTLSSSSSAFVVPSSNGAIKPSSFASTSALGAVPVLENWWVGKNGAVIGVVKNHPTIPNGDKITTSPIKNNVASLKDNTIVVTKSGSKYKLGKGAGSVGQKNAPSKPAPVVVKKAPAPKPAPVTVRKAPAPKPAPVVVRKAPAPKAAPIAVKKEPLSFFAPKPKPTLAPKPAPIAAKKEPVSFFAPKAKVAPVPTPAMKRAPTPAPATPPKEKDVEELLKKVKAEYNLNGKTIGDGKYVLVGKQIRSSSTRSQIYYAYKSDSDGLPTGPRLTVKISPTVERLERESRNYDSITFGLFSGEFVKKLEFLPQAKGDKSFSRTASALVLQSGERNLRTLFDARGKKGLEGTAMRQAAVAIAQCIQAIHSSGLVWTDLKAENFVVISNSIGDRSIEGVKGIDLESAVPVRGSPIDYSPEACPPEFAIEEAAGRAADFILQFNYDIWSFGVLLYELSVGSSLFGMKKDSQITSLLRDKNFEPDTSAVPDERLRDLIDQCLQMNPQKRPGMTQILLHPYFLTTGIGPFSF